MKKVNNKIELISLLEEKFPLEKQEKWDFSGFSLNNKSKNGNLSILVAFEINFNVINYAIKNKVNMIITYHPFLFANSWEEYYLLDPTKKDWVNMLAKHNIDVYSIHTNLDANRDEGMCKLFVDKLGFKSEDVEYLDYSFIINKKTTLYEISNLIKEKFELPFNITNSNQNCELNRIMFFPGSGDIFQFIKQNEFQKIDLLVTSDIKWNNQQLLNSLGYKYLMISHHAENVFIDFMFNFLKEVCNKTVNIFNYYEHEFNNII